MLAASIAVAIVTRDWLLALGLVMIGVESGPAKSTLTAAKKQTACQLEALATGTAEEIHLHGSVAEWTSVTSVSFGIFADNAGAPGTLLGKGNFPEKPGTNVAFAVTVSPGVSVTIGTKYWLVFVSQGGSSRFLSTTAGTATVRKSTKSTFTEVAESTEWEAALSEGPIEIWVTGTESGGVTIPLAAAASTSAASLAVSAPTTVPLGSAASASAAALAMTVPTTIPLSAAASTSAASMTFTANAATTIPLAAAASTSAASLSVSAATRVGLSAASSASSATLALHAPTTISLAPASSTSAASVTLAGAVVIPLASASATSAAKLTVTVPSPPTPRFPTARPLAGRVGGAQTGNVARTRPGKVGP